jgi:hypothetical protein
LIQEVGNFVRIIGPLGGELFMRNLRYIGLGWRNTLTQFRQRINLAIKTKINGHSARERIARRNTTAVRRINDARCESRFEDRNGLEAFQCRCNKSCSYGSIKLKKNPIEKNAATLLPYIGTIRGCRVQECWFVIYRHIMFQQKVNVV